MSTWTMIVSHRGLSGDEPESTLDAFAATVARGVEAIEFDVRRTADGVLVVFHDAKADGLAIADVTYAELVARIPGLCTLGEVLDVVPPACLLDVEVKVPGFEEELLSALRAERGADSFVVTSFHDEVVARVKALDPQVRAGLVLGNGRPRGGLRGRLSEHFPADRLRRSHSDLVVVEKVLLWSGLAKRIARLGYPVWVWTVNRPGLMRRMLRSPEVVAFVTDWPLEALALRQEG